MADQGTVGCQVNQWGCHLVLVASLEVRSKRLLPQGDPPPDHHHLGLQIGDELMRSYESVGHEAHDISPPLMTRVIKKVICMAWHRAMLEAEAERLKG